MKAKWFSALLIVAILVIAVVPVAGAAPRPSGGMYDDPAFVQKEDNRHDALTDKQLELREKALDAKLNGKGTGKVKEVARGQFVELAREGQDPVWTVLGEFSDMAHNTMPEPDRNVNNSTIWVKDFSSDYFNELLYSVGPNVNSMAQYYIEQSSNRYTVFGEATEWVTVPGEAWSYDDDLEKSAWRQCGLVLPR
ncbi:MAG: immune inhibitor A [Anaerolineales bacterium]